MRLNLATVPALLKRMALTFSASGWEKNPEGMVFTPTVWLSMGVLSKNNLPSASKTGACLDP